MNEESRPSHSRILYIRAHVLRFVAQRRECPRARQLQRRTSTMHASDNRARKNRYRRSDIARLVMSRVYTRRKSKRSPSFTIAAARAVLKSFGHASVWSGSADDLTIVRIDRTRPLSPTNAMVLQVRETNRTVPGDVLARAAATIAGRKPQQSQNQNQNQQHDEHRHAPDRLSEAPLPPDPTPAAYDRIHEHDHQRPDEIYSRDGQEEPSVAVVMADCQHDRAQQQETPPVQQRDPEKPSTIDAGCDEDRPAPSCDGPVFASPALLP